LYAQQLISTGIWIALAWCVGILIVAYALAMATYYCKIPRWLVFFARGGLPGSLIIP
jgi:hypothetical protein